MYVDESRERCLDVEFSAGFQDMNLQPESGGCRLHIACSALGVRIIRIDEQRDLGNGRYQLMQKSRGGFGVGSSDGCWAFSNLERASIRASLVSLPLPSPSLIALAVVPSTMR